MENSAEDNIQSENVDKVENPSLNIDTEVELNRSSSENLLSEKCCVVEEDTFEDKISEGDGKEDLDINLQSEEKMEIDEAEINNKFSLDNPGEDDQLLSEISDLVDSKDETNNEDNLNGRSATSIMLSDVNTTSNVQGIDENNDEDCDGPIEDDHCETLLEVEEQTDKETSKESALEKLVSRGSISITPACGVSVGMSSINKSVTITPTKSKHKPGPKSAMLRQKAKKIKIDQGESKDIEHDFNSLITFLSAGGLNESESGNVVNSNIDKDSEDSCSDTKHNIMSTKSETSVASEGSSTSREAVAEDLTSPSIEMNDSVQVLDSTNNDSGSESVNCSKEDNDSTSFSKTENTIQEGSAEILLSASPNVFYNKVQEFNRDMSIAAITVFSQMHQQDPRTRNKGKKRKTTANDEPLQDTSDKKIFEKGKKSDNGITILEALSATGLRSIRYAKEIPGIKEIIANDLSEGAVEAIKTNIEHNGVEDLIKVSKNDASMVMYLRQAEEQLYDVIDLDPYGCPSRFLDAAVQAVQDGGLLLVTCTDMAILAGNSPETCHAKYGSVSLRSPACHEMALRIALRTIESHANRYGRYITPMLSFSADFYIRVIVQVFTSPVTCKMSTSKLSMVYQCAGCQTFSLQQLGQVTQVGPNNQNKFTLMAGPPVNKSCLFCHHRHGVGGPIWSAPLHNVKFVENMLNIVEKGNFGTARRMQGMLEVIREELPDVPLYYTISGLCSKLHCQAIPLIDIRSAILNAGYRVSSSHAAPTAIKTNAPAKIIWDIMRCWVHMNPVSEKRLLAGSVAAAIILEPPNQIANFDIHPKARPSSSVRKLVRYQQNPEKNWGPGTRARCNNGDNSAEDKRRQNQNKNKNKATTKHIDIIEVVTIDDEDEAMEEGVSNQEVTATSSTQVE